MEASKPLVTEYRQMGNLHDVVLDYVHTQAYASTAKVLSRPRPRPSTATPTPRAPSGAGPSSSSSNGKPADDFSRGSGGDIASDADVDMAGEEGSGPASTGQEAGTGFQRRESAGLISPEQLLSIERRRAILNFILNGAIMRAVDALNTHFPSVLAEPSASSASNGIPIPASNGHNSSTTASDGFSTSPSRNTASFSANYSSALSSSHPGRRSISSSSGTAGASSTNPLRPSSFESSVLSSGFGTGSAPFSTPVPSPNHAIPTRHTSTNPAHVHLNLSIQSFIEHFRQINPSSPSSPASSIGSLSSSMHASTSFGTAGAGLGGASNGNSAMMSSSGITLTNALTVAQGLHQEAKKLEPEDRAVYLQEIKDVGALLAYTDPETSILKGFLDQGRRIALAEQVNRAILRSEGRPPKSHLEVYARRVTALWAIMAEKGVDGTPGWTAADGPGKEELAMYWKGNNRKTFSLADFVSHSAA